MTFPHEAVPDGAVFGPHHLYVGLAVLALAVLVVWDNQPRREPLLTFTGGALALFGFMYVWQYYPPVGALMTLAGLTLALAGVTWPGGMWHGYPLRWRAVALLGVAIAADDIVEHTFGVWTPLDALFRVVVVPVIT